VGLLAVAPAYVHMPTGAWTIGDQVGGLARDAGFAPDHDQQTCLDGIFARNEDGRSAASSAAMIAPRRNLKTGTITMCALGWLFLEHCPDIIWTAHEWPALDEAYETIEGLIKGWRWLDRRVDWRASENADRAKSLVTYLGGKLVFRTRTPGGARSLDGEKIIIDETWAAKASHMGSLVPLMSARSMTGDPQILYGSSAAKADSEILHPLVKRGRAAAAGGAAAERERRYMYVEFCAPDPETACDRGADCSHELDVAGCGCDKPEMLARANPALGRRISLEFILDTERRNMPAAEFGRERMGWHDAAESEVQVITAAAWAARADAVSEPAGPVTLSVVYSRDQRRAAIGLAGRRADKRWHVEIADLVTPAQVVKRVAQIVAAAQDGPRPVCAIAVDGAGFEAECIKGLLDVRSVRLKGRSEPVLVRIARARPDDLEWAWGRPPVLVKMTGPDVAVAYSGFVTSVNESGDIAHRGGDPNLDAALEGAVPRDVGDSGQAWGRRRSGADVAPLVAVTQARWVHEQRAPLEIPEPQVWVM
jgi:hypothetical protein